MRLPNSPTSLSTDRRLAVAEASTIVCPAKDISGGIGNIELMVWWIGRADYIANNMSI